MTGRLELSALDVARVRVGPTLGPLPEALLALAALTDRSASTGRRQRLVDLPRQPSSRDRALASFLWLSPRAGLDLFTLTGPTSTFADGRDALLDAPAVHVAAEMVFWASARCDARRKGVLPAVDRRLLPDLAGLRDGDVDGVRGLLAAVDEFHRRRVGPFWPAIRDQLLAEQIRLGQRLARGGVEALMTGLAPQVRWTGSVLELPSAGFTRTPVTSLGGRGLIVTPSFFAPEPVVFVPAGACSPALLIVAARPPGLAPRPTSGRTARPGADLLGPTRSAVLLAVAGRPRTTSQLSSDLGIALSGASQHAAVLRRAGLISTTRDGGRVLHAVTELGIALLEQVSA